MANEEDKNGRPYGEWLKAGTQFKLETLRSKQKSLERHWREPTVETKPTPMPTNLTDTFSTD